MKRRPEPPVRLDIAFERKLEAMHTAATTRKRHAASFLDFVRDAWPTIEPGRPLVEGRALACLCQHLQAVSEGRITRLLITLPPGLTKSLLVNVFWPAWEWGALGRAHLKVLGVSYKIDHAKRDGRRMRQLVESAWYQDLYGERVRLISHADEQFETEALGWRKSRSTLSVTGERCDRLNIDDPHNSATVESDTERAAVVQNIRENVLNRVNDAEATPVVMILQRLHESDIAGVILREDFGFEHLDLPMRFEPDRRCSTSIGFTDPRTERGELLFPERFSAKWVTEKERQMGTYGFAAQYQQAPVSRAGALFKRADFVLTDQPPPKLTLKVMAWDMASTEAIGGKDPDYTVGVLLGLDEAKKVHVLEIYRFRLGVAARDERIRQIVQMHGTDVLQHFPIDPGQAGVSQEDRLRRLLDFHTKLKFNRVIGSKQARAEQALIAVELNRVIVHAGPKRDDFIDELCAFPGGRYKDQVDAFADAVRELEATPLGFWHLDVFDMPASRYY